MFFSSKTALILTIFVVSKSTLGDEELREKGHYVEGKHNLEYDHNAFLGEEAKSFDQLSPEESKRRLGVIVDKMDHNKDGFVDQEELKDWITYTLKRYLRDNVERTWESHVQPGKDKITWDEYSKQVYGFMNDLDEKEWTNEEDGMSYKGVFDRDRRRWAAADLDGDNALTKQELSSFLHPEETEHMKDLIVLETLEDIDKNKDGKISLEEYIRDLHKVEEDEEEPEWVQREKEHFSLYRDKDGDGYMNLQEVKNWISPQDFDHAETEARHLIYDSDKDADQKLTKDEILAKFDLFVGSQATDFGDVLLRHDEF